MGTDEEVTLVHFNCTAHVPSGNDPSVWVSSGIVLFLCFCSHLYFKCPHDYPLYVFSATQCALNPREWVADSLRAGLDRVEFGIGSQYVLSAG